MSASVVSPSRNHLKLRYPTGDRCLRGTRPRGGFFASYRNCEDAREIAAHINLQFAPFWHQYDRIDERTDDLGSLEPLNLVVMLQGLIEIVELTPIVVGHVGVKQGRGLLGLGEVALQFLLARFEPYHLGVDLVSRAAAQDQVHQHIQITVDPFDLCFGGSDGRASITPQPIGFASELVAKLGKQRRIHQMMAKGMEHALFQTIASDIEAVVTGTLVPGYRAAQHHR